MARPNKIGLDYFPLDVDFFNDEKIGAISGEFGIKGELACIKLLCAIYRQGYFILWNEMLQMKLIKELPGVSADLLNSIVSRLVRWGFFDKTLFDQSGILTSNGIQRRYFEIIHRRKTDGDLPYLLVNVYNNPVNVYKNHGSGVVNVDINAQRKEKKRKVNNPPLPPKGESAKKKDFDFSFVENGFRDVFFEWLDYKKSRNQAYKSQNSLEVCYRNLKKLAVGDPDYAKLVVEQSIANNWNGLFKLKQYKNESNSRIFIPSDIDYGESTI